MILDQEADRLTKQLSEIPPGTRTWDETEELLDGTATELWNLLRALPGMGPVTTSKLMARKRPHLIPVLDSVVLTALNMGRKDSWQTLRIALQSAERRKRIDDLRPSDLDRGISTLRILDVAIWMLRSASTNARRARQLAEITTD